MNDNIPFRPASVRSLGVARLAAAILIAAMAAGCAPPNGKQINDPYEAQNRDTHQANLGLDKHVIRPVSQAYGTVLPSPLRTGISNASANLSLPSYVLNDLFQFKLADAAHNTLRFAVNSTVGILGLFDPAGQIGLTARKNDFGRTLYAWGAREGAYVEAPVLGPTTERDLAGTVVDTFTDPLAYVLPNGLTYVPTALSVASKLNDRYKYASTIDSIYYESADSYAQLRLLYLEKRHYDLGQTAAAATYDPYEDPYAK